MAQPAPALLLAITASAALASPPGDGWRLAFVDEFSGTEIDRSKWGNAYPWGNTHNHDAYMLERNVEVRGGHLEISAHRQWWEDLPYTSGAVHTNGRFHMTEGYVEGSFRMPTSIGSWPAFWMLQNGWPPEIDILEVPLPSADKRNDYWVNFHYTGSNGHASFGYEHPTATDLTQNWKTYGMHWRGNGVTWYLDNGPIYSFTDNAINQCANMYLIINFAVGGWPGSPPSWPTNGDTYECDWVRVWQQGPDYAATRWRGLANSDWKNSNNWTAGTPKLSGAHAFLGDTADSSENPDWGGVIMLSGIDITADDTRYIIGSGNEQIIFHDDSGTARINGRVSTPLGNELNCDIDAYSDLVITNEGQAHMFIDGAITGRGDVTLDIPGGLWLRSVSAHLGTTTVQHGELRVLGGLYQSEGTPSSAYIEVTDGASLLLRSLDRGGDLGYLDEAEYALRVDGGTIGLRSDTDTDRAILIGEHGITLEADSTADVLIRPGLGIRRQRLTLPDAAPLALIGEGRGEIAKNIDGAGSLTKDGPGAWTLSSPLNTYAGGTTINAGTLTVTGSLGTGPATVAPDATLAGAALPTPSGPTTTAVDLTLQGTLQPEGPFHAGNASFTDGARLLINTTPTDTQPRLVAASVTLDDGTTIELSPAPTNDQIGTRYTIIEATTITGTPAISAPADDTAWDTTNLTTTGTIRVTGAAGPADHAAPFGTIDEHDTERFLQLLTEQDSRADFDGNGLTDFFDALAYLTAHHAAG